METSAGTRWIIGGWGRSVKRPGPELRRIFGLFNPQRHASRLRNRRVVDDSEMLHDLKPLPPTQPPAQCHLSAPPVKRLTGFAQDDKLVRYSNRGPLTGSGPWF